MKKTIYTLTGLLLSCFLPAAHITAQTIKFPDPNFKLALISLGHDTNGDGEIQQAEVSKLKKLYVEKANISSIMASSILPAWKSWAFTTTTCAPWTWKV